LVRLLNLPSVLPRHLVSLLSRLLEHRLQSVSLLSQLLEHRPLWVLVVAPVLEQRAEWETKHHHGEHLHNLQNPSPTPFRLLLVAHLALPSLEVLEDRVPSRALEATIPRKQAQVLHRLDKGNKSQALGV
jgi:hypothetical protein